MSFNYKKIFIYTHTHTRKGNSSRVVFAFKFKIKKLDDVAASGSLTCCTKTLRSYEISYRGPPSSCIIIILNKGYYAM